MSNYDEYNAYEELVKRCTIKVIIDDGNYLLSVSTDINDWCNENLNNDFVLWSTGIYFETEEDAMAFKLRWT